MTGDGLSMQSSTTSGAISTRPARAPETSVSQDLIGNDAKVRDDAGLTRENDAGIVSWRSEAASRYDAHFASAAETRSAVMRQFYSVHQSYIEQHVSCSGGELLTVDAHFAHLSHYSTSKRTARTFRVCLICE